ncbi:hypothetical protein SRABI83_03742 [Arthrobacter sp. Bi83]|nr:hypothetical protein SRABI83_03742 [Arthrobacter sp. Bi83]
MPEPSIAVLESSKKSLSIAFDPKANSHQTLPAVHGNFFLGMAQK